LVIKWNSSSSSLGWYSSFIQSIDALLYFGAEYENVPGRFDAEANSIASDGCDRDGDVLADLDGLT
jgi:hypothetical protein